jgi:diguanylate cyclase (GGDEF)-like protein
VPINGPANDDRPALESATRATRVAARDADEPVSPWLDRYIATVALVAVALTSLTVWLDRTHWTDPVHWTAFALFAGLLVLGELESVAWLRLHDGGEVTPGWAFGFALVLLGAPAGAIAAMVLASAIPDLRQHKELRRVVFNVSQMAVALGGATLVLTIGGYHHPLGGDAEFTVGWGAGILAAAATIFLTNVVLTCTAIALHQGTTIRAVLNRAFGLSMSVDGALLALSPIFVVAVQYSMLMVPLLAVTAALVYLSARQAIERDHHANHDHLTQLLNARAFALHVDSFLQAERSGAPPCVLLLDLDGFKDINDRLGHAVGDVVLERIAERLRADLTPGVVAARLGGDEFAVFLPAVADEEEARARARVLATDLGRSLEVNGFPVSVASSIGAALAQDGDESASTLLQSADLAMYRAKRRRSVVEVFGDGDRTSRGTGRLSLLADLVQALDEHQISVAYQPQVRLSDGHIAGVEALLRWHHPTLGRVPPQDFIGLAEQTDLIGPITERVLRLVAGEAPALLAVAPDLRIAINASTRNLQQRRFVDTVADVLADAGLDPSSLEIEMTESAFTIEPERTRLSLAGLREMGVMVAIDDFGSGYSSFARLHEMPVDRLKVDQSFTRAMTTDPHSFLIVRSMIDLASALGLESVAEGVESIEMLLQLREMGCDLVQGYVLARPMTLEETVAWLSEHPVGVSFRMSDEPRSVSPPT